MSKIISIYGPAASGKTTQVIKVAEKYKLNRFSMGDTLREIIESGSELGQKLKPQVENGILIDDNLMEQVLSRITDLVDAGIAFDGFPRIINQAHILDRILSENKTKIDKVFLLNISETEVIKRIGIRSQIDKRVDDLDPKVVARRIEIFNQESKDLIDFYRRRGILVEVDGSQSIDQVFAEISRHLD